MNKINKKYPSLIVWFRIIIIIYFGNRYIDSVNTRRGILVYYIYG